MLNVRVISRLP
ncbi:hypothetical protein EYF80_065956 [Liparis tanakae]|uniref:Uncharacterized protein n=1 Tax=Liparis tanakae TaxID=230148 RepID=A0A4Z2E580_9TELE|nr:hypothetical protein EYF80_065956 [Liparis tanakae]